MRTRFSWLLLLSLLPLFCLGPARGKDDEPKHADDKDHVVITPEKKKGGPPPPALPPGAEAAVLVGDPTKKGAYALRVKFPDGYKVPAHWHPTDENVTVIKGSFMMGKGDKFNADAAEALPAGSFVGMPKEMRHFALAKGETIIQLHAIGPLPINYVNASVDP